MRSGIGQPRYHQRETVYGQFSTPSFRGSLRQQLHKNILFYLKEKTVFASSAYYIPPSPDSSSHPEDSRSSRSGEMEKARVYTDSTCNNNLIRSLVIRLAGLLGSTSRYCKELRIVGMERGL